jgi:hypothetical protein
VIAPDVFVVEAALVKIWPSAFVVLNNPVGREAAVFQIYEPNLAENSTESRICHPSHWYDGPPNGTDRHSPIWRSLNVTATRSGMVR